MVSEDVKPISYPGGSWLYINSDVLLQPQWRTGRERRMRRRVMRRRVMTRRVMRKGRKYLLSIVNKILGGK